MRDADTTTETRRSDTARRFADSKRDERQRRLAGRRLRGRVVTVALATVVVGLAVGAIFAYRSQMFEVRTVNVVGNRRVPTARVLSEAGIAPDATLLRLPVDAIRARLARDPWIVAASVDRSFPDAVTIKVVERDPVGIVDVGKTPWLVDGSGVFIAPRSALPRAVLPLIRDVSGVTTATAGTASGNAQLTNAAKVIAGLSPELRAAASSVSAKSIGQTAVFTTGQVEILFGAATQMSEKDYVARRILSDQRRHHTVVVLVDVRTWKNPAVRGLK